MSRDAALSETKSSLENPRLEVPRVFLEAAIERIRTYIHNVCAELLFNLDENKISEWEDRVQRKVIVPSAVRE
jgi:hypothetical protein